jgi:hypothetical protein
MISFPNILLPDSTTNALRSVGFVRFRITPRTTLALGDAIQNRAGIYFDFNAPVITNTAVTVVQNPTSLASLAPANTYPLLVWPNPAAGALNVRAASPGASARFTLVDGLGRTVRDVRLPVGRGNVVTHTFDVSGVAPGLYFMRASSDDLHWNQRVVVE